VSRFSPSRTYLTAAAVALGLAVFSGWCALTWRPALIPGFLFVLSAALVLALAFRPNIEIHETHFRVGRRRIGWDQVRRVDRTGWMSPLVLYLTLADGGKVRIIYPGDVDSCGRLLKVIQQNSTEALIDGVPYRQIWGPPVQAATPVRPVAPGPRYRLLTPEDEAEVERLYQKLKTAGHLDPDK